MKNRLRWLVLLLVAGTAGWAGWAGWDESKSDDEPRRASAGMTPLGPAILSGPVVADGPTPAAASGPTGPTGPTAPALPGAASTSQVQEEFLEVCGLGKVSRQEAENWSPQEMGRATAVMQALEHRKTAALSHLSARLAAGSDNEQVAARLLMGDVEGAALIGARSTDAAAYRLALIGCGQSQAAPSCGALSVQGWAGRDPEDARPWLQLVSKAVSEHDEAEAARALEQALLRGKRSPSLVLIPVVVRVQAGVDDAVGLGLAMVEIIGREFALSVQSDLGVAGYCSAAALSDASRRPRCEQLARWQFEHADSALDAMLAVGLADRVGMPADQRPYTREQLKRGMQRRQEESLQMLAGLDCASLARMAGWSTRFAQHNELRQVLQAAAAD